MAKGLSVVYQDRKARAFLRKMQENSDAAFNLRKDYAVFLSAMVFSDVMSHFRQQMGPRTVWPPWSPEYAKDAARRGQRMILQDNGKLRQSFQPTDHRTSKQGITWFNNAQTKSGFPYAFAHHHGGPQLKQRRFMWLSDKAMNRIANQTLKFMSAVIVRPKK